MHFYFARPRTLFMEITHRETTTAVAQCLCQLKVMNDDGFAYSMRVRKCVLIAIIVSHLRYKCTGMAATQSLTALNVYKVVLAEAEILNGKWKCMWSTRR